jgi:hypothetical protein
VPVAAPLQNVSVHVKESKWIGLETPDRRAKSKGIVSRHNGGGGKFSLERRIRQVSRLS